MAESAVQPTGDASESLVPESPRLEPFSGTFVPGICFDSGYCLWAFDFRSVPDDLAPFSDVWVFAPDGERTLYIDSAVARDVISGNHRFDRTVVADVSIDRPRDGEVIVTVVSDDASIAFEVRFEKTVGTRVLNVLSAVTPDAVARTRFGSALSTALLNRLVDANGTKVAGRFGTGEPYRFTADRTWAVTDATATIDGVDAGAVVRPDRPFADGDVKNMSVCIEGTAHVPVRRDSRT
ncbi:hypothetical protein [Halogeometricum limi]|uniref:Uncharacterized protein n=1 Tax=Halogeometricum limi TaxID=555875 RepID=A0A1I6FR70_9EURY|nr:hypothetical protein [Halogeometricum limi]SFR32413.1 hypothetical protein SAMN04488124_0118 [Halogeometricum limi]